MESLKELYRMGKGPSSSHTMGPKKQHRFLRTITQKRKRLRPFSMAVWQLRARAT